MYIVYEAFDDNTANIYDVGSGVLKYMSEKELITLANNNNVLGLSASNNKINYINAYSIYTFPTEQEAYEFCKDNSISTRNTKYISGYFYVFNRNNIVKHVEYYVCNYIGDAVTYVGENKSYTPYIQAAKVFNKAEAGKTAALMTKMSKTGKHWVTYKRVV